MPIDESFESLARTHRDHPDVAHLPIAQLLDTLRESTEALTTCRAEMSSWLPPLAFDSVYPLFEASHSPFIAACDEVRAYIDQLELLKPPDKQEKEAEKSHWRAERSKIGDNLVDAKKLPAAVAKAAADVMYDKIVPASTIDISLGYHDVEISNDECSWDVPMFLPAENNYEGPE